LMSMYFYHCGCAIRDSLIILFWWQIKLCSGFAILFLFDHFVLVADQTMLMRFKIILMIHKSKHCKLVL